MISIRRYLELYRRPAQAADPGPVASADAPEYQSFQVSLAQLAAVLAAEIGAEASDRFDDAIAGFSASMRRILERLETAESPEELEALSAELPKVFQDLRDIRLKRDQKQTEDVQKMVLMLQQAIEELSRGNERSVSRLRRIETQIRSASQISEIVALRGKLLTCVDQIREEAAAERRDFSRGKSQLERDFLEAQGSARLAQGVPGRPQAELRIADPRAGGSLMLVLLERLTDIKSRYGAGVSERYFSGFLSQLCGCLPSPRKIFRWNERAILVELPDVEADIGEAGLRSRLSGISRTVKMDVGGRVAVIENTHRWCLTAFGGPSEVLQKVEDFLGA